MLQFCGDGEQVAQQIRDYHQLTAVGVYDLNFNFGYYSSRRAPTRSAASPAKSSPVRDPALAVLRFSAVAIGASF